MELSVTLTVVYILIVFEISPFEEKYLTTPYASPQSVETFPLRQQAITKTFGVTNCDKQRVNGGIKNIRCLSYCKLTVF